MNKNLSTLFIGCLGGVLAFSVTQFFFKDQPKAFVVEKTASASSPYHLTNETPVPVQGAAVDFTYAAEQSLNSVVHIKTSVPVATYTDPFYEYFFGPMPKQNNMQVASGSGVIIGSDGYIVTNNHVINNAEKISVTLNNNKSYEAKVIGTDPGTDIALIKVDANGLPAVTMGNSDDVKIGEWVLAVGNPFNLTSTVTAGIVSAKSRNIHILEGNPDKNVFPIESFIQTDAAVNPGNSGGALVNAKGELIGINTAIASTTGSYSGYSFAVPVNLVQKVTSDLRKYGVVQRGFLGVNIRNIDQELADELNMDEIKGVYVGGTVPGGAAEKSGIKEGDIILNIGEREVNSASALQEHVGRYRPGDVVNVRLIRGSEEMIVPVTLQNMDGTTETVKKETPSVSSSVSSSAHGAVFRDINADEKEELKIKKGVKVISLEKGKLSAAGIKKGFIITKVDDKEVASAEELSKWLKNKKGAVLVEGVYPDGTKGYYAFGL
ncbi:MAG: Do family serine endopeptidase [Bacteroidota bacterium]